MKRGTINHHWSPESDGPCSTCGRPKVDHVPYATAKLLRNWAAAAQPGSGWANAELYPDAPRALMACVQALEATDPTHDPTLLITMDGEKTYSTLSSFIVNNQDLSHDDFIKLGKGEALELGGGASPHVRVERAKGRGE
jgi:hypothetical protein